MQEPIPLHIGGAGRKLTLPLVARHADWWNCVATGVDRLAELRPLAGRARVSTQHPVALAASAEELPAVRTRAERRYAGWGGVLVGTAPEIAASLAAEARSGVEGFVLTFHDGGAPATLERFAREVIPAVRAAME